MHVCMAILYQTAKFKSANTQIGGKPPNLMTANISGYMVYFNTQMSPNCIVSKTVLINLSRLRNTDFIDIHDVPPLNYSFTLQNV